MILMRITYILLILLMFLSGCNSDFDPPGKLEDEPRMMAIVATPPQAPAGAHVSLTLYEYDPHNDMNTVWLRCIPFPGEPVDMCPSSRVELLGMTELPPCTPDMVAPCVLGYGDSVDTILPEFTPQDGEEDMTIYYYALSAPSSAPLDYCSGFLSDPPVPDDGCLVGIKRVIQTPQPDNENPHIWTILVDGVPTFQATTLTAEKHYVSPALRQESLDELTSDGYVFYPVQWFTDCGELSSYRQDMKCELNDIGGLECDYDAPVLDLSETTAPCTLHVVILDNLGGVAYRALDISPTPD